MQGYFTGTYNAISAKILHGSKAIGELSGKWSSVMDYKNLRTGDTYVMFDAKNAKTVQKTVPPLSEQAPNESQR